MLKLGSLSVYDAATDDSRANAEYFKWLITKHDEPEEHRSIFSLLSNLKVTCETRWHKLSPTQFASDTFAQVVSVVASLQSSVKRPLFTRLECAPMLTLPRSSSSGADTEVSVRLWACESFLCSVVVRFEGQACISPRLQVNVACPSWWIKMEGLTNSLALI